MDQNKTLIRLSKIMAERGLCSRREADELISQGLVIVNGAVVSALGTRVPPDAEIKLLRVAQKQLSNKVTILINKPLGYVSSQPELGYKAAVELITEANRDKTSPQPFQRAHLRGLAPAGRLDIDSKGLLIMTQDGVIARKLIGSDTKIEKEYLVRVEGHLSKEGLQLLNHGLSLDDKPLKPAVVRWQNEDQLQFILKEGRKRQIRRMCELVGLYVVGLKRVRIGNVKLGALREGQWRYLLSNESF